MAVERHAPVAHCATDRAQMLVPGEARSPRWLLAVPNSEPDATNIALLSRSISLRFTATEVARVQILLAG
jgi:hypothetical protein